MNRSLLRALLSVLLCLAGLGCVAQPTEDFPELSPGAWSLGAKPCSSTAGGKASLEEGAGPSGTAAVRWEIDIGSIDDWVLCHHNLWNDDLTATQALRFRVRSDVADYLLVRLELNDGRGFSRYLKVETHWTSFVIPWEDFGAVGLLNWSSVEPGSLRLLQFGEGAAGRSGKRTLWFADLGAS